MGSSSIAAPLFQYNPTCSLTEISDNCSKCGFPEISQLDLTINSYDSREARLAERARIARELHDTLLQGLFAASMHLHDAADFLPADFTARTRIDNALSLMDRVLAEGRRVVMDLRGQGPQIESLGDAFAAVPATLGFPSAIEFRVIVYGRERRPSQELTNEIYRIGCEAIINAFRHSGATVIEVELEYRSTSLQVRVRDNGCGIDLNKLNSGRDGHWGILGMSERAEVLGAGLRVWSKPSLGTEIELCLPVRRLENRERGIQARVAIHEKEVA